MEQWKIIDESRPRGRFIATETGIKLATVYGIDTAEQIVREHNSHDALLTACKYVLAVLKQYDTNSPTIPLHTKYIEETLEAALSQGEKEPCKHVWGDTDSLKWLQCVHCGELTQIKQTSP